MIRYEHVSGTEEFYERIYSRTKDSFEHIGKQIMQEDNIYETDAQHILESMISSCVAVVMRHTSSDDINSEHAARYLMMAVSQLALEEKPN